MLKKFKENKKYEIEALRRLKAAGELPPPWPGPRLDFAACLRRRAADEGLAVIAEYKRASPSAGVLNTALRPEEAALAFVKGGAAAMSVLTEKSRFQGRRNFITQAWEGGAELFDLPIMRKDFIFDPLQARATAALPAAALLLIVRLTPEAALLRDLRLEAESFGLAAAVEAFDERDLELARESGAKIILANARDFSDLSVDLSRPLALARRRAAEELWIAASGLSRPEELKAAAEAGFDAVLAGEALMRNGSPAEALRSLKSCFKKKGRAGCYTSGR